MRPSVRLAKWIGPALLLALPAFPQNFSGVERGRALDMWSAISRDVQKHYYDPKFHGVDWEATVAETKQKIKQADSMNLAMAYIASALMKLNDSHLFFEPPSRPYRHDYGLRYQVVGDQCLVTQVRPGSDAAAKGIKPGDAILAIGPFAPARDNLWKIQYRFDTLRPQAALPLSLRDPAGNQRELEAVAKMREMKRVTDLTASGDSDINNYLREEEKEERRRRARTVEIPDGPFILNLPSFVFPREEVDAMIGKARKHDSMILDLRGNPGGSVDTLKRMVGSFFDKEVRIAGRMSREGSDKPLVAKPLSAAFTGRLVVLIDSRSASAAELFARVIQLEKRGTVLGDRSSGSVMEARGYSYHIGTDTMVFYGASITDADLVMSDGKSLESSGVTPDETTVPTAADLAADRDPVLARAVELLGKKVSPEQAGKMFPYQWPDE
jgi:carboxyl-terminal processing protease